MPDWFAENSPDNSVNPELVNGAPPGSAQPTGEPPTAENISGPTDPVYGAATPQSGPVYGPGAPNGNPAGNAPAGSGDPVAFIRQWQATHPPSANAPAEIAAALKAAGFNASPYMYGNTPSGNEISLNGEKYKVIGGEGGSSPFWYRGENDSPGGGGIGLAGPQGSNGLWNVPGGGPLNAFLPLPTGLDYTNDPGYKERMKLGTDAIQNSAAAKGNLISGKTLADLTNYGQTFGSNEYGTAFDRAMKSQDAVFGRNLSIGQLGYAGANSLAGYVGDNARTQSGLTTDQGQASAARDVTSGNNTAQSLADLAALGIGAYYNGRFGTPGAPARAPVRYNDATNTNIGR